MFSVRDGIVGAYTKMEVSVWEKWEFRGTFAYIEMGCML